MKSINNIEGILLPNDQKDHCEDMATLFCHMNSEYQAEFFNEVARISAKWKHHACFQWRYMEDDLTENGKRLLQEMYENTSDE